MLTKLNKKISIIEAVVTDEVMNLVGCHDFNKLSNHDVANINIMIVISFLEQVEQGTEKLKKKDMDALKSLLLHSISILPPTISDKLDEVLTVCINPNIDLEDTINLLQYGIIPELD